MKFLLIYYTGTYNTRYLTSKLQEKLSKNGHSVEKIEINSESKIIDTNGYDFIGFGYPIYAFNTPRAFDRYFKKLKFSKGQKYFIYKNSGETLPINNASSRRIIKKCNKKEMILSGEYHFVMPYNIHFPFERAFIKEILQKDDKLLDVLVYNLQNGIVEEIKSKPKHNLGAFFLTVQKNSGNFNSRFYRVEEEKCVKCYKCVKTCPQKNVYVKNGKIKFHHHCDMCMRCSLYCPQDAIRIGILDKWGWRVNGGYNFDEILKDDTLTLPYITKDSAGFYKCFIKTFEDIDAKYDKIFKN